MQSIKNTGVAVMLLFLSYGVYQVIMKPMPEQQHSESIEFSISDPQSQTAPSPASVTQPLRIDFGQQLSSTGNDGSQRSSATLPLQPVQPFNSQEAIPEQLLNLPQQIDQQISQNDKLMTDPQLVDPSDSATDVNPPSETPGDSALATTTPESRINDFGHFQPAHEPTTSSPRQTGPSTNQFVSLPDAESVEEVNQFEGTPLPPPNEAESVISSRQLLSDTSVVPTGAMTNVATRDDVAPAMESSPSSQQPPLAQSWSRVQGLVEAGQFQEALADLSQYYRDKELQPHQRTQLLQWLDALAAKVIYSSEHHLRSFPYVIQPDDTIATLARDWQIPAQLIYNVNAERMPDPNDLTPGVEIKMIQGPFDAEIDPVSNVMTLFLDDMYAGRFSVGSKQLSTTGDFRIVDKSAADQAGRPFWMQLNNGVAIYGSESGALEANEIALNTVEAEELFSILSATSNIRVLR